MCDYIDYMNPKLVSSKAGPPQSFARLPMDSWPMAHHTNISGQPHKVADAGGRLHSRAPRTDPALPKSHRALPWLVDPACRVWQLWELYVCVASRWHATDTAHDI